MLRGQDFHQNGNCKFSVKRGALKNYKILHDIELTPNRDPQDLEIDRTTQRFFSVQMAFFSRGKQGKYVKKKRPTEENRRKNGKNAYIVTIFGNSEFAPYDKWQNF